MASDCIEILVRRHSVRPSPIDRYCRPTTTVITWVIPIALAFAASFAGGQEAGYPSNWRPGKHLEQSVFAGNIVPIESALPEAPASVDWQLSPALQDVADTPRNRALEIVQRRDDYAVRRYRQGFLQRLRFSGGWIDRAGEDDLGISNLKTSLTVAIPLGSFENLLLITPGFEADSLNGPTQVDAPTLLYDVGVDFMWRKQFNDRWGIMVAVRPAVASDFQTNQDSFRVTGRALATWQWLPERLALLFGIVYLDRNDLPILPGVGLIWTPNPDWRIDLIFPRPKLARRLMFLPRQREDWVYLGGSLGGRTWAVERLSGGADQLTLRDYRLSLGWERILDGGSGLFTEVGYVFGRELEYEDVPLTRSFEDAIMLRGGVTY